MPENHKRGVDGGEIGTFQLELDQLGKGAAIGEW